MVIECVPNVSEGRRTEVIDRLAEAVQRVPGARLLDRSSDTSHNRSVLTFAGQANHLQDAVLALFEAALAATGFLIAASFGSPPFFWALASEAPSTRPPATIRAVTRARMFSEIPL